MSIKPSICVVMVSNIRVFFIFIVAKIECWPVFKQDPVSQIAMLELGAMRQFLWKNCTKHAELLHTV